MTDRDTQRNEGEGNKTAARAYNKDQQAFVKSGKVDAAADKAEKAIEGQERKELDKAAEKGESKRKGEQER